MAKQPETTNPDLVTVVIAVDNHEHAGQPVSKGESIQVDRATAQWLDDNKLIEG
ncbi:MAG: hypothetical protein WCS28_12715 [Thiomicrospira sp.]|jgi:hypothetical protein